MPPTSGSAPEKTPDRVFVRDGRRHFRRTYALAEVRIGAAILLLLGGVAAWVAWKGRHPDPALFASAPALLAPPARLEGAAAPPAGGPSGVRGPLPTALAPTGWSEGTASAFDAENLYVKVNGRADFYLSLGFQHLWVVPLTSAADPTRSIDIELFDQGQADNAIGAYAGERAPGATTRLGEGGLSHLDRNALFLTRGRYYARVIGSDESDETQQALSALQVALEQELPGEPLPWSYALFVGGLGLAPDAVSFVPENAFSFAFASAVHVARIDDGGTEVFVVSLPGETEASALVTRFDRGFLELGKSAGEEGGVAWVADRYLGSVSGATAHGSFAVGVHGAPDRAAAGKALAHLVAALDALPPEVIARAHAGAGTGGRAPAAAAVLPSPPDPGYAGESEPPAEAAGSGEEHEPGR